MSAVTEAIYMTTAESYSDLLYSPAHWLFELTVELITAPIAFALGWLWRSTLLRHLHRDLHSLGSDVTRECLKPTSGLRSTVMRQHSGHGPDVVPAPPREGGDVS
jgi:hypothetical protein